MYSNLILKIDGGLNPSRSRKTGNIFMKFLSGLYQAVRDYNRRQQEYRYLLEQPDYLLEDIGLTRPEIYEARKWYLI